MDNPRDLLTIGKVSKTCQVSVKTLRHYDEIGLVKPIYVCPENQYRYYEKKQIDIINTIKLLKVSGFSLAEIQKYIAVEDKSGVLDSVISLLQKKEKKISGEIEKLEKNRAVVTAYKELYQGIQLLINSNEGESVTLKNIPARTVVFSRIRGPYDRETFRAGYNELVQIIKTNNLKAKSTPMAVLHVDPGNFNPADADIETCFLVLTDNSMEYPFTRVLPVGLYATLVHKGNFETLRSVSYPLLFNWLREQHYRTTGPVIEIYLIASPGCRPCEKNIIELQVPVIKAVDPPL